MSSWHCFARWLQSRFELLAWFYRESRQGNLEMYPGNEKSLLNKIFRFIIGCHQCAALIFDKKGIPVALYPTEAEWETFFMNFDKNSQKIINTAPLYQFRKVIFPEKQYVFIEDNRRTEFTQSHIEMLDQARLEYNLPAGYEYNEEAFVYHHGLANAPQELLTYIRGKAFIDAGSYIGDSALVLSKYSPSVIFSFDISEVNGVKLKQCLEANPAINANVEFIRAAVSDRCGEISFLDSGCSGTTLSIPGKSMCKLVTIDSFMQGKNEKIGYIKADLEGMAYEMTMGMGMLKTIERDRPVLCLAVYHTMDEFYGIWMQMNKHIKNYAYRMVNLRHLTRKNEIVLFAWPNELQLSSAWWWDF